MKTTITLCRASDGWRWQMTDARNGRIIGAATEGYDRRAACLKNLKRVIGLRVGQTQGDVQRVVGLSSRMFTSWELKQP